MALNAFTDGQTLQQIVADVERLAGNPKLHFVTGTVAEPGNGQLRGAPAYRWLLSILRDLYLLHDWAFTQSGLTYPLPSGARSINLPNDYWRLAFDNGCFLIDGNTRIQLEQWDRQTFFGPVFQSNNTGQPHSFFIERKNGAIWFEPIPSKAYLIELHYFRHIQDLDDITDVPVFPHTDYLISALLVKYFIDQDDPRAASAEQQRVRLWAQIRGVAHDIKEDPQQEIPLDPQWFRTPQWGD
jgi:hypothetical protein